jgi:hypothetical protein
VSFAVRAATAADAPALAELEREARDALVEARGGPQLLAEQPPVGEWASVLAEPEVRVWVAAIDDVIVGYLQLRLPPPGGAGVVTQVFVLEDARAEAIAATVAAGGTVIESFALPGDRDTKNLYERAGVTARKIIVSKRLV